MPSHETSSYLDELKSMPRPAWFLFLGMFVNRFGTFVIPFLVLYMKRLGYSPVEAGAAISAYGLGNLPAVLIGGYLADRIGRRRTIAISMFTSAAFMMLLSQAATWPQFLVLSFFAGAATELYRPASAALLTDLVPPARRVAAFALLRFAINLGWAFGTAAAGFIADFSFLWLFVGNAATSVLFGFVALITLPHGVRVSGDEGKWKPALHRVIRDKPYQLYVLAMLLVAILYFQWTSTFAIHLEDLGFSTRTYGLLLSLNGLLIVFFELPISGALRRLPPRPVIAVGFVLCGLGLGLNIALTSLAGLIAIMCVFSLGEIISAPASEAYAANLAPNKMRGRYRSFSGISWSAAIIIGPAVGMTLYEINPLLVWIACLAIGALAALVIMIPAQQQHSPDEKNESPPT